VDDTSLFGVQYDHARSRGPGSWTFSLSLFSFFFNRVSVCHPGWSAVVQSQLPAASNSWAQAILPPRPPG
uniref:Uncharacterized protein n=1 Tax=Prolemur simus TaxID=1328070 RepID=A0A8C8YV84_PROSS